MSKITRRDFLRYSAYGAATLVVSQGLAGCSGDDDENTPNIDVSFTHGVASGDPLSDRVILWTRVRPVDPASSEALEVSFEVATDAEFANVTHNGTAAVSAATDYTLKIDAVGLESNSQYYYRFRTNGTDSPVGTTKTLPAADTDIAQVKFAVFSCSNYPTGFFNVYDDASRLDDIDAALHLGDYIYEYALGEYGTENALTLGRTLAEDNDLEIVELEDYRKRYALYRTDSALQKLHQQVPFIVVPDDHEVTNDAYIDGAENHQPESEGEFGIRKANALQAYFEWLPIRPHMEGDNETLHRSFQWGNLVNLMMLDTRITGRSKQLPGLTDPQWYNADGSFNTPAFVGALGDNTRTILGSDQLTWLQTEMTTSPATWQVLGQQVLMGRMNVPFEILAGQNVAQSLTELSQIKLRMLSSDPSLTAEEITRVETAGPYNLDAWDGYAYERELVLGTAASAGKNLVVLAGDTHNAWANNLTTLDGTAVGVEFATASVTSPGLEAFFGLDLTSAQGLEQGFGLLIDGLQYTNLHDRGYMVMTFTAEAATADWRYVNTIESKEYASMEERSMQLQSLVNANQISTIA